MLTLIKHELKQTYKSLLIWSLTVGGIGLLCICLYASMTEDMAALSESFSNMGAFSDAFGMSTLGIGTIAGYFATEVGAVHGLGSAMFAAILATTILSKEEDGHTGEFLFALPVSRGKVIAGKLLSMILALLLFTAVTLICYLIGFEILGEAPDMELFYRFMGAQLLMNLEIMLIITAFSAFQKRNLLGAGLGIALLFYVFDLIGRVIPDLKDMLVIGPFSFANASEIFVEAEIPTAAYLWGLGIMLIATALTFYQYTSKDLAS